MLKKLGISKYTIYILPVFCLLITGVVGLTTLYPWWGEVRKMQNDIDKNKQLLEEKLIPKAHLLQTLDAEMIDQDLYLLEEALPSFPQEWSVLASLEALASESQVDLGSMRVSGIEEDESKGIVRVPLVVEGNQSQVLAFLKNLEKAKRVFSLQQLSWEVDEENVHFSGTIAAPFWMVPSDLGATEKPLEKLDGSDQEVLATISRLNLYGVSLGKSEVEEVEMEVGKSNPF